MGKNAGKVVVAMCLLGENDFKRFNNRDDLTAREYADYIEQFYDLQAEANTNGYKNVVVLFNQASFNEYLKQRGHEPVTEDEYAKERAAWAYWFVTNDPQRFGV